MRQKLQNFKKQIRKNQITSYISDKRQQQTKISYNKQTIFAIQQENRNRKGVMSFIQPQPEYEPIEEDPDFGQKCTNYQEKLKQYYLDAQFKEFLSVLQQIAHELKKVIRMHRNQNTNQSEKLAKQFLQKNILSTMVSGVIKATQQQVSAGQFEANNRILQQLSKRAIIILGYAIQLAPTSFSESLFIDSDLLLFLRCCIDQPKFDQSHLMKIIIIMTHMIVVSVNETGRLFQMLNLTNSKFHFSAIFYNLTRIELKPGLHITQNFIIFLKHYLLRIEQILLKERKNDSEATPVTCLENNTLDMVIEIATVSVNALIDIDFYEQQAVDSLEEALEVIRILIEYFKLSQKNKFRLDFRGLLKILYYKDCRMEIKYKILTIIDHIIFEDALSHLTEFLVRQCELIPSLWLLRDDFYCFSMNIFCNLALSQDIKPFLSSYVHNIFSCFKYNKGDKMLWMFVYNWFSCQDFEILESRDKLVVELMKDSQQTNPKILQIQCLLWYQLALHNQLEVPQRILQIQLPSVRKLKTKILGYEDVSI